MANWPTNPDWSPAEIINNGIEFTTADGILASDQNKIIENMIFLYNHLTNQHVYVGTVTTITGDPGTNATVKIVGRQEDSGGDGDPEVYLDFTFTIPRGKNGTLSHPAINGDKVPQVNDNITTQASVFESQPYVNDAVLFVYTYSTRSFLCNAVVTAVTDNNVTMRIISIVETTGWSAAAGMSTVIITVDNWTGTSAPYTFTIAPSVHGMGNTPNLMVMTLPSANSSDYDVTYDSPTIASDGTITLTTLNKWAGKVLIVGGAQSTIDAEARTQIAAHVADKNNPHGVTKAQVGLSNVMNERQYSPSNPPPYPVASVNGSTTPGKAIYAPTSAGTNGYILASNGSGAPSWVNPNNYARRTLTQIGKVTSNNTTISLSSAITNFSHIMIVPQFVENSNKRPFPLYIPVQWIITHGYGSLCQIVLDVANAGAVEFFFLSSTSFRWTWGLERYSTKYITIYGVKEAY